MTKNKNKSSPLQSPSFDQQRRETLFQSFKKIPRNHITIGLSNAIAQNKQQNALFQHRRLPSCGWTDFQIQSLVMMLSALDTNHISPIASGFEGGGERRWCGIGEREGRVYSSLVSQRHFGLSHGIGRSGDIMEPQPKAVGSSVIAELTLCLVLDAMKRGSGLDGSPGNQKEKNHTGAGARAGGPVRYGIVLPLCTGMSMSLVLTSLRDSASDKRDIVLWSRIDQKSCFKAILAAGLTCVVVPTKLEGGTSDQVVTDLEKTEDLMEEYGNRVLAVVSTTSCFAPRVSDRVDEIAKLCQQKNVAHVINNAYGLQCERTSKLINRACVLGRVDAMVCSTDKNFLVPVGGAIVTSPVETIIKSIGKMYAGRASSAPILDLFITLLSMGLNGYKRVLEKRKKLLIRFGERLEEIATKYGERSLKCPQNTISFGMTLDTLGASFTSSENNGSDGEMDSLKKRAEITSLFGSMLFTRCISGTRVVPKHQMKTICGYDFVGFGSSTDHFPHAYLTAACAIGLSDEELEEFFVRLDKCFKDYFVKRSKKASLKDERS